MNYLAHILLSYPDDDEMLGNFLGDFVRKKDMDNLPKSVQEGVNKHRIIDKYTDGHESVKKTVELLRPALGRYASVASDIIYDHYLCLHWHEYSKMELRAFCDHFYYILNRWENILPRGLKSRKNIMIRYDFLMSTADEFRLKKTMQHMEKRTSFKSNFTDSLDIMKRHHEEFDAHFNTLFMDLKALVK